MPGHGRLFVLEVSGGGRLFSVNPDGSDKQFIVTGMRTPDGIAVDVEAGHVYWTDRSDIEVLFKGLPEPIDLEIDSKARMLYWTDRGDPPQGNSVNRGPLDAINGQREQEILSTHLMEGIGLALDPAGGRLFVTDLAGNVYRADLDGSNRREILVIQGNLTGIAYAEIPDHGPSA